MDEPLTPDEDVVFRELTRMDVEPHQIPVELYSGFLGQLAKSCNLSLARTRMALQGLIDKGIFDTGEEEKEEHLHHERTVFRDLILHDPEIQEHLKKIVAELCADKK